MKRFLALALLAAIALVVLAVWVYPSGSDFRADNPFWNGLRDAGGRFHVEILPSLTRLPSAPRGTVLVEIPYLEFSPAELQALQVFLLRGGTLLLMDDYGQGNQVLAYLGVDIRFTGAALLDPVFNYRSKWLPRITELRGPPGTKALALNHATSLEGAGGEIIALSSSFSFLDQNGNEAWDQGEPTGPLAVAARARVGEGRLIMVADPSLLINSMLGMEDNLAFITSLLELGGRPSRVLLDQSHLPEEPLEEAKGLLATARGTVSSPPGLAAMAALPVFIFLARLRRQKGAPDWQ